MKKVFFSLVLSLLAFQINAASISLNTDDQLEGFFAPTSDAGPHTITLAGSPAGDVWETHLSILDLAANSVTGFGAQIFDSANQLVHTLTGNGAGITLDLALDTYTVNFLGTPGVNSLGEPSFGWSMLVAIQEVQTSAVPVPAAVWLFGSALMGLVGVSRRKSTSVAA